MKMCVALSVSGIFASTCSQPFPYACTGSPSLFVSCLCYPLPVALFPGVLCLFVPWIFMSKYLTTHLQLLFCVCIICYMYLPQHLPLYTLHLGHLTTPVSLLILHIQNPCRVSGFLMCSHCFLNIFQCKRKREKQNKTKHCTHSDIHFFGLKLLSHSNAAESELFGELKNTFPKTTAKYKYKG